MNHRILEDKSLHKSKIKWARTSCVMILMPFLTGYSIDGSGGKLKKQVAAFRVEQARKLEKEVKKYQTSFEVPGDSQQRLEASLALGIYYSSRNPQIALQYISQAEILVPANSKQQKQVMYYRGLALFEAGYQSLAVMQWKGLLSKSSLDRHIKRQTIEKLLHIFEKRRDIPKFIELYERYRLSVKRENRIEHFSVFAALIFKNLKQPKKYFRELENLALNYPVSDISRWAFNLLETHEKFDKNNPQMTYYFSWRLIKQICWNLAADDVRKNQILKKLDNRIRKHRRSPEVLSSLDRVTFFLRVREYKKARKEANSLYQSNDLNKEDKRKVLILMARINETQGQMKPADSNYREIIEKLSDKKSKIAAQEALARVKFKRGLYIEAAQDYKNLLQKRNKRSIRWHHFWTLFRGGQYKDALTLLGKRRYVYPLDRMEIGTIDYWRAKILEKVGRSNEALAHYHNIVRRGENGYYGSLVKAQFKSILQRFGSSDGEDKSTLIPDLGVDQLSKLNLYASASRSILLGELSKNVRYRPSDSDRNDLKLYYPLAYDDFISKITKMLKIDKFLLLGVMRAESYYNATARSSVGATGLMQIMPYTGMRIAAKIGDKDFRVSDLRKPELNISYGAWYLKMLMSYYNDNYMVALAAYNAGPEKVNYWLKQCKGCSVDEFVESIPYRETRRYVKKITGYYATYRQIYLNKPVMESLPEVPTTFPDFAIF